MICPYCNNQIPDGSLECFVCGEDLLPKSTSEYYMDMDAIKEEDEKLYDKVAKQVGIETKPKLSGNQKMAMIITAFIALFLILLSLDVFKFIKYKSSSNYEKKHAIISGVHYIPILSSGDLNFTTDCEVVYEFNGELRYELVKAGIHYKLNDALSIYVDMDGNPYNFVFSFGDFLQLIIICALTALTFIVIMRWHVMPNADGHLNYRSGLYNKAMENRSRDFNVFGDSNFRGWGRWFRRF